MTLTRSRIWPLLSLMTLLAVVIGACTQQGGGGTNATDQADPNGELVTNMGAEPDNIDPQQSQFVLRREDREADPRGGEGSAEGQR